MANEQNGTKETKQQQQRRLKLVEVKTMLLKIRPTREGTAFDVYEALLVEFYGRLLAAERQVNELIKAVRMLAGMESESGDANDEEQPEEPQAGAPGDKTPFPEGFNPGGPNAGGAVTTEKDDADEGEEEEEGAIPKPDVTSGPPTNVTPIPKKA